MKFNYQEVGVGKAVGEVDAPELLFNAHMEGSPVLVISLMEVVADSLENLAKRGATSQWEVLPGSGEERPSSVSSAAGGG
jgi:hypothetical protein